MQWILALILLLAACNRSTDPAVSARDSTLAQVNNTRITVDQFNQKWSQLPDGIRAAYSGPNGKKDFLGELITRELLLEKAHRMKLDQDKAVGDRVADFKDRLLLDAALHELVEKKIEVTEDDLTSYFNVHRDALPAIEEARAGHILVKTEAEAKALLARLRRGANFAALARTHSIDPGSKDKGGDLGVVRKGRTLPEIEEAVFGLKPGRISGVVKTAYGYHLVRVQNRQTRKPLAVDDVRDEIRQAVVKEKETALFEGLIKTLKTESKIVISDSLLASIGDHVAPNHDSSSAGRH
ncbi:MAG: peptidylprolyl isomerase [Nitrospirae bacterium]|nr:peptidylprolyl isomerase [Nitrospirota bacterium]